MAQRAAKHSSPSQTCIISQSQVLWYSHGIHALLLFWPSQSIIFPPGNKEVNSLVRVQHLSGSLSSGDGSQYVSVVARIKGSACPAGLLPLTPGLQHVTHLAVEMGEGGQSVKYQVPDSFDGIPETKKDENQQGRSYIYPEK